MNATVEQIAGLPKIRADAKRRWLKALRSGEYTQATGALCEEDPSNELMGVSCCCLGVGLNECHEGDWVLDRDEGGRWMMHGNKLLPPPEALHSFFSKRELEKYNDACRRFEYDGINQWPIYHQGYISSLDLLNDEERLTFAQIADLIEEQY